MAIITSTTEGKTMLSKGTYRLEYYLIALTHVWFVK